MTDFQVLDSIPEQTPATGEHPSFGSEFYHWCMLLLIIFPLLDMDIDFDVDPTPAVDETTIPAPSTQTAPEASIDQEVIAPAPAVIVLPAPPVPPATSGVENIEKSPIVSAAASG